MVYICVVCVYIYIYICMHICVYIYFPSGSAVKSLPSMQEMQVQSLGQEDSLEEDMASHSSILVWRIPWAEEPGGL